MQARIPWTHHRLNWWWELLHFMVWVCTTYTDKSVTAREWASNTPAEALASFRERRRRQIGILKRQLRRAEIELALTEGADVGTPPAHQPYLKHARLVIR